MKRLRWRRWTGLLVCGALVGLAGPAWAQDSGDATSKKAKKGEEGQNGEQADGEQADGEQADGEQTAQQGPSLRRGNRMEFDARLIRGESAGSGAVFLFERAQRPLPSMIDKRTSFLHDTVDSVLGNRWAKKFDDAQQEESDSE